MKKVFWAFVPVFYLPSIVFAFPVSSEDIKKFYDNNHGALLDYYWVRPREIYDPYSNASHFMTSYVNATYVKKPDLIPWLESFKDYLGDNAVEWSHELDYRVTVYQDYKKETPDWLEEYAVKEENGKLEVFNQRMNFVVGTFDLDGKYDYRGYYVGMMKLELWKDVFFDPWDQRMYFREFIEKLSERNMNTHQKANADQFLFRFKGESQVRKGKIELANVAGFKAPVALFNFQGRVRPVSRDIEQDMDWERDKTTLKFAITYHYDEQLLKVCEDGVVDLAMTAQEFLAP